ncbi:HNH endonuclease [Arthrobacter sp. SO5]|uniref:HNH endonuclease n=1 Tax=Arthrobacter sp. SO5 TaxID=1897055 RepID=UPI001E3EBD1A|nr:HNH endonuclease [Arthrobacter sp. SO5]
MAVDWVRDEILLVCELLQRNAWKVPYRGDPLLEELSELLKASPLHAYESRDSNFRSSDSVRRKAWDLVTQLPTYQGKPTKGNRLDRIVLEQFRRNPTETLAIVEEIKEEVLRHGGRLQRPVAEDVDYEGAEGKLLYSRHRRRERDPKLRNNKIAATSRAGLPIACEVCSFDFGAVYGIRGRDFIEVHHVLPLYVSGETKTKLSDLALLCSNCHRMIHRGSPWLTPHDLSALVKQTSSSVF